MVPVILLMGLTGAIKAQSESTGPVCEQADNRVPNPGFEPTYDYQDLWVRTGAVDCQFDNDSSAYEGENAAIFTVAPGGEGECTLYTPIKKIEVEAERYYDLSAWVRVAPDSAAYLVISFWSLDLAMVGDPVQTPVVTDTLGSWFQVTKSVQTPAGAAYVSVEATGDLDSSSSEVWFDKIYFGLGTCLELVKNDDPHEVLPRGPLTYTIVYSNSGREEATGVVVVEEYDEEYVQYESAVPEPNSGTNNIWDIGALPAGESGVITVVVQVEVESASRNWLRNKVSIDADEISNPISDVLYTKVITDGVCAIDLVAFPESKTGNPGQTVDYEVELLNVGLFEGDAHLTATSDLDLGITFDLATFYTLNISSSASTAMHLHLPATLTIPSTDTTWITATLECPGDLTDNAHEPVSTTIAYYTLMAPSIMKDYCSTNSWEVEPNDSCVQAHGPLCLGEEFYGYPDDADDYYLVYAPEGGISVDLNFGGGYIPTSEGIQLLVYKPDLPCPSVIVGHDPTPEDGYHLDISGVTGPLYIRVFKGKEPFSTDWTYTLRASPY